MSPVATNKLTNDQDAYRRPRAVRQQAVRELGEKDGAQVLELLSEDPLRGVHLRSMIEDHGLCHPAHRGRFFGYFEDERLVGVALLGHAILIYGPDASLSYFAQKAAEVKAKGHVIFGPQAQVEAFWQHLAQYGRETRLVREHAWYVCQQPRLPLAQLQLRRANLEELDVVADAQAEMSLEESGTDPRLTDLEGFRCRVAERIERKRTWVKLQDGQVVFKAELQSVTPEVVYLEGIWTHPDYRNRGIAESCLTELAHRLLRQHLVLCLAVEAHEQAALRVYKQVGFVYREDYQARYLTPLA